VTGYIVDPRLGSSRPAIVYRVAQEVLLSSSSSLLWQVSFISLPGSISSLIQHCSSLQYLPAALPRENQVIRPSYTLQEACTRRRRNSSKKRRERSLCLAVATRKLWRVIIVLQHGCHYCSMRDPGGWSMWPARRGRVREQRLW
jgi:hypothetical protein